MLSSVEAWWAGLCAQPFDGAQGDTPLFVMSFSWLLFSKSDEALTYGFA
jgi:hypothetical protein